MDGHPGLVARRDHLHGRVVQEGREADLRQGGFPEDPAGLFNASLEGNMRRAIDIHEGDEINEPAFRALVRQAAALNNSAKSKREDEDEVPDAQSSFRPCTARPSNEIATPFRRAHIGTGAHPACVCPTNQL